MNKKIPALNLPVVVLLAACGGGGGGGDTALAPAPTPPPPTPPPTVNAPFVNVSATEIPVVDNACMDARQGDVDGDGDIDLALASERALNIILLNDGNGRFTESTNAITAGLGDNEDLVLADLDGDGDLDIFAAHEDDRVHVLLYNDGSGIFTDMSSLIPVESTANAVEAFDVNGDGRLDILLGNDGANFVLVQQPDGSFVDETATRPIGLDTTQDLLLVDVDGDSDLDLFVANEGPNALFINDGAGNFTDETAARLPSLAQESREADAADIDNDGDLDLLVGNIQFNENFPIANQLLLNDGTGVFTDVTATQAMGAANLDNSFTVKFIDLDNDGDQDALIPRSTLGMGGNMFAWLNDGFGNFTSATVTDIFSEIPDGSTFDVEVIDANGDGNDDLFLCNRTGLSQYYQRQ